MAAGAGEAILPAWGYLGRAAIISDIPASKFMKP
jgi:hypothetical protein